MSELLENIESIRARIDAVRHRCGIEKEVRLMAVTKFVGAGRINEAIDRGGIRLIGENRPQELAEKAPQLHLDGVEVHFIGTLQTNKVRTVIERVSMIHSLDSVHLAAEIDRRSAACGRVTDCLIEVNIGREANKGGVLPEQVLPFYESLASFHALRVRGLMTVAPYTQEQAEQYRYFEATRRLYEQLCRELPADAPSPVLSMGMSESFEVAVECGADIVRVGSGIFGARNVNKL